MDTSKILCPGRVKGAFCTFPNFCDSTRQFKEWSTGARAAASQAKDNGWKQSIHRAWAGTQCHPHCSGATEGWCGIGKLPGKHFWLLFPCQDIKLLDLKHIPQFYPQLKQAMQTLLSQVQLNKKNLDTEKPQDEKLTGNIQEACSFWIKI